MEEAQELSDHVAIMDRGKIIAQGSHDELVQIVGEQDRIDLALSDETGGLVERWRAVAGVSQVSADNGAVTVLADDSNLVLPQLFEVANQAGVRITSVAIQEPNLETVFLHLTGRALRD